MVATRFSGRVITRRNRFFQDCFIVLRLVGLFMSFLCREFCVFVDYFYASARRATTQVGRSSNQGPVHMPFLFPSVERRSTSGVSSRRDSRCPRFRVIQVYPRGDDYARLCYALRHVFSLCRGTFLKCTGGYGVFLSHRLLVVSGVYHARDNFCAINGLIHRFAKGMGVTVSQVVVYVVGLTWWDQDSVVVIHFFRVTSAQVLLSMGYSRWASVYRGVCF